MPPPTFSASSSASTSPVGRAMLPHGIPKRDRSQSLVVDRVTPLICVDSRFLDDPKTALLMRRRSSRLDEL